MDGMSSVPLEDNPIDKKAGLSPVRERRWGLIGGTVGPLVGVGAALVAVRHRWRALELLRPLPARLYRA